MFTGLWSMLGFVWVTILATFVGLLWYLMYNLTPAVFLSFVAGGLCVIIFWSIFKGADIIYDMRRDKAEKDRMGADALADMEMMRAQAKLMAEMSLAQQRQNRALLTMPVEQETPPPAVTYGSELFADD